MSDIVVSADWLADRLDDVRIVDVRDAWEYEGIGHIPGAVNVPFDDFRADAHAVERDSDGDHDDNDDEHDDSDDEYGDSDDDYDDNDDEFGGEREEPADGSQVDSGGRGMLPGADVFAALMSEAGISREDDVVAYDDHHGVFAARFLVTAQLYGHDTDRLHLLDGDFSAWRLERETTSDAPEIEPTTYEVGEPAASPLIDIDEVAAAVDSDAVVVDTREDWEYEEGHIPGAVRLDWRELVDDETRGLKPRSEMGSLLAERGITPDRRVVLYCNTARRISHTYVVLRHLGYEDVAFYEGSLTEWRAAGRELETGPE